LSSKKDLQAGSAGFSACFIFGSGICRLMSGRKKQEQKQGRFLSKEKPALF
jgi:hypothetical protein